MLLNWERLMQAYGAKVVLDLGHGEIAGGRITGIIGPNGAGKTTQS